MSITRLKPTGVNSTATFTFANATVTSNISSGNANLGNLATASYFSGSGNLLANIQAGNITGTVSSATTAGTVTTNAQPNITSVGTLNGITSNGAVTINANTTHNGWVQFNSTQDRLTPNSSALSGTVTLDMTANGPIFYLSSVSSSLTANFINVPSTANVVTTAVLIMPSTSVVPGVIVGNTTQTIKWPGGTTPTPNSSQTNVWSFIMINNSGTYSTLGSLTTYN
jgi:hypothetical protein